MPSIAWRGLVCRRNDRALESELGGLAQSLLTALHRPDLTRQADFAKHDRVLVQRDVFEGRINRHGHREIGRRLADPHAADGIDEDIHALRSRRRRGDAAPPAAAQGAADRGPPRVAWRVRPAPGSTSACTSTSKGREPSSVASTQLPGTACACCDRNSADGLATPFSPRSVIANTPSSLAAPKRFLIARTRRKLECVIAFEIQHGVDNVLEHARAGDRALLGHVADQDDGDARSAWRAASAAPRTRAPGRRFPAPTPALRCRRSGSNR